jgi:hypothetical protein
MSDAKAGAKGGDEFDGYKGGGGESKGEAKGGDRAEAKGGGRDIDTECSESDYARSAGSDSDVRDIKEREVCIVKRSDGSWKYATLRQWDREYAVIVVNDAGVEKTYGEDSYCDVRRLDCESGSK